MNQNVCVSTCLSVCVCVSVYLCACIPLCLCASVYMYVSVYEYVCVRVCVCHLFAVQQGVPGAQHCVSYRAFPAKSASNYICRNVITFDKCKTQTYFPRNQPVITFYKSAHLSKSTCTHSNIYPLHTHTHQHMQRNKYIWPYVHTHTQSQTQTHVCLHVCCMSVACVLHVCCMCIACVLHVVCMCVARVLHVRCMCTYIWSPGLPALFGVNRGLYNLCLAPPLPSFLSMPHTGPTHIHTNSLKLAGL